MKKGIIFIIILAIIIGIIILVTSRPNVEKILEGYEIVENDGFGDDGGYIVANKTEEGYRYGYINYKGKTVLETKYNMIHRIAEVGDKDKVYLIASKDGRYGVTVNDKTLIDYEYQFIEYNNSNGVFVLNKNNRYGVSNLKGKILINVENDFIESKGMYIYIKQNGEEYVCDIDGQKIDLDFNTTINPTGNEQYYIKTIYKNNDYKYLISDRNGKSIIDKEYNFLEYAFDNYFIACNQDGKQGIIDTKGNIKIEFNYSLVQKVQNSNVIRTLNVLANETEIYSNELEKICTMKNSTIEIKDNEIKIYNQEEEIILDKNGKIKNN